MGCEASWTGKQWSAAIEVEQMMWTTTFCFPSCTLGVCSCRSPSPALLNHSREKFDDNEQAFVGPLIKEGVRTTQKEADTGYSQYLHPLSQPLTVDLKAKWRPFELVQCSHAELIIWV